MVRTVFCAFIILILSFAMKGQQIIYVNDDAQGFETGRTWADAFTNLKRAIANSNSGDEIWIATGLYPTSNAGNRFAHFQIEKNLTIYGGFRGFESSIGQRTVSSETTTLTGEISDDEISQNNAFNVLRIENSVEVLIDGVTIEGAYGSFTGEDDFNLDEIGAVLIDNPSNGSQIITFSNVLFTNNFCADKGAAIYMQDKESSATQFILKNCRFENNLALVDGSAIYMNLFSNNAQVYMDSLTVRNIDPTQSSHTIIQVILRGNDNIFDLINSRFEENVSTTTDPMVAVGLFGQSQFTFSKNYFIDNTFGQVIFISSSDRKASEIYWTDLVLRNNITFSSPLQILNTSFADDRANVYVEGIEISENSTGDTWILMDMHEINLKTFDNNKFLNNKGGPLFLNPIYSPLVINNCLSANNEFKDVDFSNQFVFKNFDNHDIDFINCTFAFNDGLKGSIVRTVFNQDNGKTGNISFQNCIFFQNIDEESPDFIDRLVLTKNSNVNFDHCLFSASSCGELASIENRGVINCNSACLFNDDPHFSGLNSYDLSFCSPAIDAGENSYLQLEDYDIQKKIRIENGSVDIGAIESIPLTRNIGFNCLNGIIYSDWISGIDKAISFEFLSDPLKTVTEQVSTYVMYAEGGCTDTLYVPARELNAITFYSQDPVFEVDVFEEINLSFSNFSGSEVNWTIYPPTKSFEVRHDESLSFKVERTGMYYLIATNEHGCYFIDSIQVRINRIDDLIYIPNSFSPNSDGINDHLSIALNSNDPVSVRSFRIYSRYGGLVSEMNPFELATTKVVWDPLSHHQFNFSSGVYVYILEVELNGDSFYLTGDITLVK